MDLELETVVGNITSTVIHQVKNFWVVNKFPWYAGGIHQCICTHIREVAGEEKIEEQEEETYYYPIQYNWVDKMVFMGREIIGIEYIGEQREVCIMVRSCEHQVLHDSDGSLGVWPSPPLE